MRGISTLTCFMTIALDHPIFELSINVDT